MEPTRNIGADRNPGGLWLQVATNDGDLLLERAINVGEADAALRAVLVADSSWREQHPDDATWALMYDGDTGDLRKAMVRLR